MTPENIQRIGIGTDIHRLAPGRQLILGHVAIEHEVGPVGHSDGDVVLHAIIDAMAGAAGLPDIGEMFPDTDPAYKGVDSAVLLERALAALAGRGYAVVNVDVTIHLERPKLRPYKQVIRTELARLLGLAADAIGVKAKTNEGMDAVGQGEAIACMAVVGLRKR